MLAHLALSFIMRDLVNNQFSRLLSRPMPSKWNDEEKWLMKRQNVQPKYFKNNNVQNQTNWASVTSRERVSPELSNHDPKSSNSRVAETKLVDLCQPASHMAFEKFSFAPLGSPIISGLAYGVSNTLVDQCCYELCCRVLCR